MVKYLDDDLAARQHVRATGLVVVRVLQTAAADSPGGPRCTSGDISRTVQTKTCTIPKASTAHGRGHRSAEGDTK